MRKIILLLILLLSICLSSCSFSQIEDTNGDEDTSLSTLTKDDIFDYNNSITVGTFEKESNNTFSFSCKKLSGNYLVKTLNPNGRVVEFSITTEVIKGNAYIVLMSNNEVIKELQNNGVYTFFSSTDSDKMQLRILGESCEVKVEITYNVVKI